jgi:uncharacterized protein (TIGR03435 family)
MLSGNRSLVAFALAFQVFAQAPRAQFEVATVKFNPNGKNQSLYRNPGGRLVADNRTLKFLVSVAFGVKEFEVQGGPSWVDSDHFDIAAKAGTDASFPEMLPMLQALLEDRFKLAVHRETKEQSVYVLAAAKGGLKLPDPKEGGCVPRSPDGKPPVRISGQPPPVICGGLRVRFNGLDGFRISMEQLAGLLSEMTGRRVVERTGFPGVFDASLKWSPDQSTAGMEKMVGPPPASIDMSGPSIFTALQDQLGLKLESQKAPVEIVVIDHAETPTEN